MLDKRAFLPNAVARDVVTNIDVGSQRRQTGVPRCRAGGKKRVVLGSAESPRNSSRYPRANDDIALHVPTSGTGRGFRRQTFGTAF